MLNINLQMKTWVRKQRKLRNKCKKYKLYPLFGWKWATMPKLVEAPLLDGGAMAQWRWRRWSVGGLRGKGVSRHPRAA